MVPVLSPTGLTELSEEEELKMALEESLKGQVSTTGWLVFVRLHFSLSLASRSSLPSPNRRRTASNGSGSEH